MLIAIANILDPDQARQNVGPDLDQKMLDILMVIPKEFFENVNFERKSANDKTYAKLPSMQRPLVTLCG